MVRQPSVLFCSKRKQPGQGGKPLYSKQWTGGLGFPVVSPLTIRRVPLGVVGERKRRSTGGPPARLLLFLAPFTPLAFWLAYLITHLPQSATDFLQFGNL